MDRISERIKCAKDIKNTVGGTYEKENLEHYSVNAGYGYGFHKLCTRQ